MEENYICIENFEILQVEKKGNRRYCYASLERLNFWGLLLESQLDIKNHFFELGNRFHPETIGRIFHIHPLCTELLFPNIKF